MQVEKFKLSIEESTRRCSNNLCLYCVKPKIISYSTVLSGWKTTGPMIRGRGDLGRRLFLSTHYLVGHPSLPIRNQFCSASIFGLMRTSSIPLWWQNIICLEKPLSIASINVEVLAGAVQYCNVALCLQIRALHREKISFFVLPRTTCSLPFLVIGWTSREVTCQGKHCFSCISAPRPPLVPKPLPVKPPALTAPHALLQFHKCLL